MEQIFHEIKINTKGQGLYDFTNQTISWLNKQKIDNVWVLEENIAFLADYIRNSNTDVPQFGICHGTRRGKEQEWFSKYLGCKVIGTEISDTAENFPNTLQWDFHETKAEWIDAVDFVYSNSFDHSYDPEECLNAWMSCVKSGGICIIEHTSKHSPLSANQLDPFGAHLVVMPYLIARWGKGQYGVHELVEAPAKRDNTDYVCFIIVKRFDS